MYINKIKELVKIKEIEVLIQYLKIQIFLEAKELRFKDAAYLREQD